MLKLVQQLSIILQRVSLTSALYEETAVGFEQELTTLLQTPYGIVNKGSWQVECSAV